MIIEDQIKWLEKYCDEYDQMWNAGCEDVMIERLKKFCADEKLPYISADELLHERLSEESKYRDAMGGQTIEVHDAEEAEQYGCYSGVELDWKKGDYIIVHEKGGYIECTTDGNFSVIVCNDQYYGKSLYEAEQYLYRNWAFSECDADIIDSEHDYFSTEIADRIWREIQSDAKLKACKSFSELHEHCDANVLGHQDEVAEYYKGFDSMRLISKAQDIVDGWIKNGREVK